MLIVLGGVSVTKWFNESEHMACMIWSVAGTVMSADETQVCDYYGGK